MHLVRAHGCSHGGQFAGYHNGEIWGGLQQRKACVEGVLNSRVIFLGIDFLRIFFFVFARPGMGMMLIDPSSIQK
jgi:hypothetical protein